MRQFDRAHIRGERADRFRLRSQAWDEQPADQATAPARAHLAQGLEALADERPERRGRLEELDAFYAWWEARIPELLEEWQEYKRTSLRRGRDG